MQKYSRDWKQYLLFGILSLCMSYSHALNWVLNNPYPKSQAFAKIYYSSFSGQPKTLDPAKAYTVNEYLFINQVLEPLLQYDYFIRPYQLIPLTASKMPLVKYYDKNNQELADPLAGGVQKTVYTLQIKPGTYYQPHPAFAKDSTGHYRYLHLAAGYLAKKDIHSLADFAYRGSRELTAEDYIYQIKRLANPAVNSPIYGVMTEHIEGFKEYAKSLPSKKGADPYVDLRQYPLSGLRQLDKYTFEISIKGLYPQFIYWLAMPFFSPTPWEADRFYSEPDMDDRNLNLSWYPVGTGPFMLTENNPNRRMVLDRNPNFRLEYFPTNGSAEDEKKGYLVNRGKTLPMIDRAVYILEKESIPRWNKFLQGYYDLSGVSPDSFDQAIQINSEGKPVLTQQMLDKGMSLSRTMDPSNLYLGFNMLDPIVGGNSERARKLRLAISIAVNYEENIAIFFNGRGKAAQSPLPPGIFGHRSGKEGMNPYVYRFEGGKLKRRPIEDARKLLAQAGYPKGIDPETGAPLILHYDIPVSSGPDEKAQLNWMNKQFAKLGIELNIRSSQYNYFQEKMRSGNAQIYSWGWNADYPDPENFLFLLYGPNGKVKFGGENSSNYSNPEYDRLFLQMKNRGNDAERQALIDKMLEILRHDAPWAFGIHAETLLLKQIWVTPVKPNAMSTNTLKFISINVPLRNRLRQAWNQAVIWPLGFILLLFLVLLFIPFYRAYHKKQRSQAPRIVL